MQEGNAKGRGRTRRLGRGLELKLPRKETGGTSQNRMFEKYSNTHRRYNDLARVLI
jgi:hypothetical protein